VVHEAGCLRKLLLHRRRRSEHSLGSLDLGVADVPLHYNLRFLVSKALLSRLVLVSFIRFDVGSDVLFKLFRGQSIFASHHATVLLSEIGGHEGVRALHSLGRKEPFFLLSSRVLPN